MTDAPAYRVWPPLALGVPLLVGVVLTATVDDPFTWSRSVGRAVGLVLVLAFAVWNGAALREMGKRRTALLPGGATRAILDSGPFGLSRNPLYVGLIVLDIGLALLWPSAWALLFVPVGFVALRWGAVLPEERYLIVKFGDEYASYKRRVRRWL